MCDACMESQAEDYEEQIASLEEEISSLRDAWRKAEERADRLADQLEAESDVQFLLREEIDYLHQVEEREDRLADELARYKAFADAVLEEAAVADLANISAPTPEWVEVVYNAARKHLGDA